ncbi:MAG: murein L,D-transpeptidase catalytic domain-containing protein [Myxococcota bacterium]
MAVLLLSLACAPSETTDEGGYPPRTRPDRTHDETAADDTGEPADTEDTHEQDTDEPDDTDTTPPDDTDTTPPDDTDTHVEEEPCPADVVCVTTFPYEHTSTTTGAARDDWDSYGCASSTDESGPEVLYRVDVPEDGFVALTLTDVASGADVDVHLLASEDPDDCVDRGHEIAGGFVEAGRYWVVADTWVNSTGDEKDGAYTLVIGLTSVDGLVGEGLAADFAEDSLHAFDVAWDRGDTDRLQYAVTDFSMHSSDERMWVLDLTDGSVLHNIHVAHGEGSSSGDSAVADTFSNTEDSHQSSLGMVVGAEEYTGTYGDSMRLDGLEDGFNDAVRDRAIVVHPWQGSRAEYVARAGETAETWGCPGIDDRLSADVIDQLADGGLLFFWYPDAEWLRESVYLR